MEAEVYKSLAIINESLETAAAHIQKLQAAGMLLPQHAELHRLTVELLRADLNQMATLRLHTRERLDAAGVEKLRLEQMARLNGQDPAEGEQEQISKPAVTAHSEVLRKSS